MATCPRWLSPLAKEYWAKNYRPCHEAGLITPLTESTFAVLCESYADYRQSEDNSKRKALDLYIKLANQFKLTPKSAPKIEAHGDEIEALFDGTAS